MEVLVKEYKSKYATLFGQINQLPTGTSGPGRYPLMTKTSVIDLISKARGPRYRTCASVDAARPDQLKHPDTRKNADLTKVELLRKGKTIPLIFIKPCFTGTRIRIRSSMLVT